MRCWSGFLALLALPLSPPRPPLEAATSAPWAEPQADLERAGPTTASELLKALSAVAGLEAEFVERKKSPLLAKARTSSGRLYYLRGGYLAQVTLKPRAAQVTITPTELRITEGDRVETLDLRQNADVRLIVRALAQVWTGDEAALRETFEIEFETAAPGSSGADGGDPEDDAGGSVDEGDGSEDPPAPSWTMALTPKGERLKALLTSLTLEGRGYVVGRVRRVSTSGAVTVTEISAANPKRRFTDDEKARLFGIEPGR